MSLFKKQDSYLGVDIGAHGIKLVELKKTKGRAQLWTYGIAKEPLDIHLPDREKTPEDLRNETQGKVEKKKHSGGMDSYALYGANDPRVDKYAAFLREVAARAKVTTKTVTASLPVSHIFHTIVTLPIVDDKDIEPIVEAEVQKVLDRPIEEMQIVHQKIPSSDSKSKYIRVLVTAAPKVLVGFYSAIFQKAGLELRELETEAFAIERSLVGKDPATMMVLDIGAERTNFFIIDQSLPMTHRSIQLGGNNFDELMRESLGFSPDIAGQIKQDSSFLDWSKINTGLFDAIIDPMAKEIQYSFDLFLNQSGNQGKKPEKIVLTGGAALFPPIQKRLAAEFQMKVFVGDPWARVVYQQSLKPVLDAIGPRMGVAIGLGLRNI